MKNAKQTFNTVGIATDFNFFVEKSTSTDLIYSKPWTFLVFLCSNVDQRIELSANRMMLLEKKRHIHPSLCT